MANERWSSFPNGGPLQAGDILVGIRAGVNEQFIAPVFESNFVVVTTPTQAMLSNTTYIVNDPTSLVTFTLPSASAVNDRLSIVGVSTGGWIITQGNSQQIQVSPSSTTLGLPGSLASTNQYDSLNLICIVANTIWSAIGGGQTQGFTYI